MARTKQKTARQRWDAWLADHPTQANVLVGAAIAAAVITVFLFVTFSGFGSSAEFIYSQF